MAATFSSIVITPPLPTDNNTFTNFSPFSPYSNLKPLKTPLITTCLKPISISHLPLLFPLHLCRSASGFEDAPETITDALQENSEQGQDHESEDDDVEAIQFKGSASGDDECRLFVGNLPFSTTPSQLSEAFAQAGQVTSVEIIYDKVTDRSRGFGFVTMSKNDEAKEAIRMFDGSQIGGRTMKVNFPEVPRGGERKVMGLKIQNSNLKFVDSPHKIYASNLGWSVTSQGLTDAFASQPGFLSAKVIYERGSGRSRGFGFISFSSAEAAESALSSMNGVELEGRPLRLNMAAERARPNTEANAEPTEEVSAFGS